MSGGRPEGLAYVARQHQRLAEGTGWSFAVELFVEPDNAASRVTALRAGYVEVELLPGHLEIGGRQRDVLRYRRTTASAPPGSGESMLGHATTRPP